MRKKITMLLVVAMVSMSLFAVEYTEVKSLSIEKKPYDPEGNMIEQSIKAFCWSVESMIEDGWELVGGVSVYDNIMYQAMVKY